MALKMLYFAIGKLPQIFNYLVLPPFLHLLRSGLVFTISKLEIFLWSKFRANIFCPNNWNGHHHCGAEWRAVPCSFNHCWRPGLRFLPAIIFSLLCWKWSVPGVFLILVSIMLLLVDGSNIFAPWWDNFRVKHEQVTRSVDIAHGRLSPQEQKTVDAIVRARWLNLFADVMALQYRFTSDVCHSRMLIHANLIVYGWHLIVYAVL